MRYACLNLFEYHILYTCDKIFVRPQWTMICACMLVDAKSLISQNKFCRINSQCFCFIVILIKQRLMAVKTSKFSHPKVCHSFCHGKVNDFKCHIYISSDYFLLLLISIGLSRCGLESEVIITYHRFILLHAPEMSN